MGGRAQPSEGSGRAMVLSHRVRRGTITRDTPMARDAHLHNAAATPRDILTRSQPDYPGQDETLPCREHPGGGGTAGPAGRPPRRDRPPASPEAAPRTTPLRTTAAARVRSPVVWEPKC